MTTYLTDYGLYTVSGQVVDEVIINLKCTDLNYATFVSPTYLTLGSIITIKYGMHTSVFVGKVVQCRKLNRTVDGKTRYAVEVHEPATDFSTTYITEPEYTGIYLKNTDETEPKTLGWYVSKIIANTDWVDASDQKYKDKVSPPGVLEGEETSYIPSMGFSVSTVSSALNRLIVNIFNYGLWYDYYDANGSEVRRIRYGEYRNDVHPSNIPIDVSMLENTINHNVTGVIVYGDTNDLYATAGTISGSGMIAYRYVNCQSINELKWVALRIYNERHTPSIRYEITFPSQYFDIHEGDRIHIYDTAAGLGYSTTGYGVKDVEITNEYIKVGVGAANMTIFDVLNDRLSIIDGSILSFEPMDIDSGWHNVYASSDLLPTSWGASTSITVSIDGSSFLGEYYLSPLMGGEQIEGAGFMRIFSAIANTDTDFTIASTNSATISASSTFASSDWFPWSWKWAEVEVKYIFDSDLTEEDSQIDWNLTWGNTANPNLYTVDNDQIVDSGGTQPSSAVYSTCIHKWFVTEKINAPQSWPTLVATCHSGTTSASIKDLSVRVTIYYEAENTYPPIETTMASGEIQMRAVYPSSYDISEINYSNWITIYESTGAASYDNITYDMEDYILYSRFGTGDHTIEVRLKGTGNAAVYLTGTYAAFDEKTKVIT